MITKLEPGQIFVFGANRAGRHGAGAARQAMLMFGAKYGIGEGMTGNSYAFPTLGEHLEQLPMSDMERSRDRLYVCCRDNPGKQFLLTKVGCGLAGYRESDMRDLFMDAPGNLILPEDWK